MPEENQTWDTATNPQPETSAAPVVDVPVVEPVAETPPAEAATLEKTDAPQLEAEPAAVRETESEPQLTPEPEKVEAKDDYVAESDDPPEIAALSTAASKRWAKRQFKEAEPVRNFRSFDVPISQFGDDLHSLSASRYTEHVIDIFKRHAPDLLGVPFDEVKSRLQPNGKPVTTPTSTEATISSVLLPTETELQTMSNEQVAQRIKQIQEQERQALTAEFQKQIDDLRTQFEAVDGEVKTQRASAAQAEIVENQNKLYSNVWSVVDDGIRESGLEVLPTDPPKIASLKRAAARLLDKHNIEAAFDAVDDNTKLVKYVYEATNRREFQNAFREEDNLKVRARAAFESVKQSPEVKAILDEIEAYVNQSKEKSRATNPIPPAPGSSLGVAIKPPTTWDEAERAGA
jgi:hypothetical protein